MRARTGLLAAIGLVALVAAPLPAVATGHITGSWTHVPALPDEVSISTATGGNNGRVFVFGVCEATCHQSNGTVGFGRPVTYVWDPVGQRWRLGRGAPRVCAGAKASALGRDGLVRLAGCWTDMLTDPGFRFAVYDPAAKTWTLKTSYGPYVDPIVGLRDRNGRVMWYSETLRKEESAVFVSGHRIVQAISGTWHRYAREPASGPSDGAAVGSDGRVYVAGGSRNCFPAFELCDVPPLAAWSPATNSWSRPTSLPTARIRVSVPADAAGRVFTIGGLDPVTWDAADAVEVWQPASASWASARRLPAPRFEAVATATPDGRVWVFGGYDESGEPLSDGYMFSPR